MNFKEWLKLHEVGTATNAIATFARPIFSEPFRRDPIQLLGDNRKKKKKKNLDLQHFNMYDNDNLDKGAINASDKKN